MAHEHTQSESSEDRRSFLARSSTLAMAAGLLGAGGASAAIAGRYLFPALPTARRWIYLAQLAQLAQGQSMPWRTPAGERIALARVGAGDSAEDFIALSSTCPHLGCQVHWEGHKQRFFCPCHNGVFTPTGTAIEGPPSEAGQSLARYPLKVEGGLLFIEVPVEGLTIAGAQDGAAPAERA